MKEIKTDNQNEGEKIIKAEGEQQTTDAQDNKNTTAEKGINTINDSPTNSPLTKTTREFNKDQGGNEPNYEKKYNNLVQEVKIKDALKNSSIPTEEHENLTKILLGSNQENDIVNRINALNKIIENTFKSMNLPTNNINKQNLFEKIIKTTLTKQEELKPTETEIKEEALYQKAVKNNF